MRASLCAIKYWRGPSSDVSFRVRAPVSSLVPCLLWIRSSYRMLLGLSYCRHLRTVRKHLLYLVDTKEMSGEEEAMPVDEEFWKRCRTEKTVRASLLS